MNNEEHLCVLASLASGDNSCDRHCFVYNLFTHNYTTDWAPLSSGCK